MNRDRTIVLDRSGFAIDPKPESRRPSALKRFANGMMVALNIIAVLGMVVSAFAQRVPPSEWRFATIVTMTFPIWLTVVVVLFALDLRWWRRTAWIAGLGMLTCISQIYAFTPLNIPNFGMTEREKARSFTVMTYNVYCFEDQKDKNEDGNRQMDYILEKRPDIVCLQEARYLSPNKRNRITQAQLDSLHIIYPYILTQGSDLAILSKMPVTPINLDFPASQFSSGNMAAWRFTIDGKVVNLFSVHLRSLGLSNEDKSAYEDIVKLEEIKRSDLRDARTAILPKISQAGEEREAQARLLQKYLGKYGGKNAIVVGDFNDPVGCYSLYLLQKECKMRQAYEACGFGPAVTYNANYLYFRIDQVLYRGNLRPYSIKVGGIDASDHYPVITRFILD